VEQHKNARGEINIESDTHGGTAWDGPLGVLINRNSASASEIFAAAIQDYGRGLVFGERSFGKGTVQTLVDLDRASRSDKRTLGDVKMTVAQFFRINGGTTQLRGVAPDIAFPSSESDGEPVGEASLDNPLPWTQIAPVTYAPVGDVQGILPALRSQHEARLRSDQEFQALQEDINEARVQRKKKEISLNERARRAERDALEAKQKARDARTASAEAQAAAMQGAGSRGGMASVRPSNTPPADGLNRDDGLQADERNIAAILAAEKARKEAKDIVLNEAARILSDAAGLASADPRVAARIRLNTTGTTPN
jgi:carboxyl-terminal processing protease